MTYLEKDKVRGLIDNAMKGLQASGRIENVNYSKGYLTPQATNSQSKPSDAESQVNLDQIQTMIEKYHNFLVIDFRKYYFIFMSF